MGTGYSDGASRMPAGYLRAVCNHQVGETNFVARASGNVERRENNNAVDVGYFPEKRISKLSILYLYLM